MDLATAQAALEAAQQKQLDTWNAYQTAQQDVNAAQTELTQAQAALVEQVTNGTAGPYSSIDQLLRAERFAGKQAAIQYIQANPTTATQAGALAVWTTAGIAATTFATLLEDPALLCQIYSDNLYKLGLAPDNSWASLQAWIIATPEAEIMAE